MQALSDGVRKEEASRCICRSWDVLHQWKACELTVVNDTFWLSGGLQMQCEPMSTVVGIKPRTPVRNDQYDMEIVLRNSCDLPEE